MATVATDDSAPAMATAESNLPTAPKRNSIRAIPSFQLTILYVSICMGMFLALLDTSIVATALFTIGTELNDLERVNWVALAYTLAYLGCSVTFARIGDIVGRRNAYLAAFLIFLAFSVACGAAQTLDQLIAFRVLQGIGGAGLFSLTMIILPEITPPEESQRVGGMAGGVVAVAGVLGPVLGGVITHYTTWRWVFWINGPTCAVAASMFLLTWPKADQMYSPRRMPWRQLDVVGSFLLIGASVLVVYAFQSAGLGPSSWNTASFLAPLCAGLFMWGLLFGWAVLVHRRWREQIASVMPIHMLKQRVYVAVAIFTLLMGFPYFQLVYALPLRFQVVNGADPLHAGLWLLPTLGAAAVGATLAGALNTKRNNITATLVAAGVFLALGTGLLSSLSYSQTLEPKAYGFQVFVGLGFGLAVATASLSTSIESSLLDGAVAQGIVAQARMLGGSLGIAASTAILGQVQLKELAGLGISAAELSDLRGSIEKLTLVQLEAVLKSYAESFREGMWVAAAVSAATVLAAVASYRRHNDSPIEVRAMRIRAEIERERGLVAAAAAAKGGSGAITEDMEEKNAAEKVDTV